MLETAGPSQMLAPVHRQQVLPKCSHLSTDGRSFPKARTYPLTEGPSISSHLSNDGRSFPKARTCPPTAGPSQRLAPIHRTTVQQISLPYHLHKNLKPIPETAEQRFLCNNACWEVESNDNVQSSSWLQFCTFSIVSGQKTWMFRTSSWNNLRLWTGH